MRVYEGNGRPAAFQADDRGVRFSIPAPSFDTQSMTAGATFRNRMMVLITVLRFLSKSLYYVRLRGGPEPFKLKRWVRVPYVVPELIGNQEPRSNHCIEDHADAYKVG
jgi:hypothetical protein